MTSTCTSEAVHFLFVRFCRFMYCFDICYFMQESIEPVVLEEHQSEVVVDPLRTSEKVCLCIAFSDLMLSHCTFLYVYVSL